LDIINVENLSKSFGDNKAVKEVSFNVKEGEIFGLLGPNGAGKTTTIQILVTILKADSGRASINGFDVEAQQNDVRKSVGIIFQDSSLDERLTAWENLFFHSKLYHVSSVQIGKRIEESLELVGLQDKKKDLISTFSGGMKRRLEIARGIIHTPKVFFLDEPTIGLDPQTRNHIWEYLTNLRKSHKLTMLLTTHYMEEAEICDRIAIIDNGEIIALDTPQNLKNMVENDIISCSVDNLEELLRKINESYPNKTWIDGNTLKIEASNGPMFVPKLFEMALGKITGIDIKKPSLEDVFIKLTGKQIRDAQGSGLDRMRASIKRRQKR
jgi:ABC-2 type transport system ATP-binding protein